MTKQELLCPEGVGPEMRQWGGTKGRKLGSTQKRDDSILERKVNNKKVGKKKIRMQK